MVIIPREPDAQKQERAWPWTETSELVPLQQVQL
jgi:hypothetical protein